MNEDMAMITKNTTLSEVLKHPGADRILERYKIPCLHCPMAIYETERLRMGDITKTYGIDLMGLLQELNRAAGRRGMGKAKK